MVEKKKDPPSRVFLFEWAAKPPILYAQISSIRSRRSRHSRSHCRPSHRHNSSSR